MILFFQNYIFFFMRFWVIDSFKSNFCTHISEIFWKIMFYYFWRFRIFHFHYCVRENAFDVMGVFHGSGRTKVRPMALNDDVGWRILFSSVNLQTFQQVGLKLLLVPRAKSVMTFSKYWVSLGMIKDYEELKQDTCKKISWLRFDNTKKWWINCIRVL